jgi:cytochrome c-type biogenesis protein CcmH/NrfF
LQIAHDLKRTVAAMLRDGIPRRQIVEETSALYGIPTECVEEVVAAVPAENRT